METQLLNIATDSLPKGFVKTVMTEVERACGESYRQVIARGSAGQYGEPEMNWILGYERRAVWEKKLRDIGKDFGLGVSVQRNAAKNHEFTQIIAGRLKLTCSHKLGPDYFMLRSADFRKDHARLNTLLSQSHFPFAQQELQQDDGGLLNAIIFYKVHDKERDQVEYLRIGFPDSENEKWAHKFDFYDLLGNYPQETMVPEDTDLLIRWKRKVGFGGA